MPSQCAVWECKNRTSKDIKLFRYPLQEENRLPLWIKATNRGPNWNPTQASRMCSEHFSKIEINQHRRMVSNPQPKSFTQSPVPTSWPRAPLVNLPTSAHLLVQTRLLGSSTGTQVSPEQRSVGSQTIEYTTKLEKSHKRVKTLKADNRILRLKNKALLQKLRRSEKLRNKYKTYIDNLWGKLDKCLLLKSLMLRFLYPTKKIDTTIRCFTKSLIYYSTKAHNLVRISLAKVLPTERIIRKWTDYLHLKPGFIDACLFHLRDLSELSTGKLYCSLQLDEIHLREQVLSNGETFDGYVDYGGFFEPKNKKIANSALVLMAVGMNKSWKVPIAYFFTKGLPAKFLRTILPEALSRLDHVGITCKAVVFDGLSSNRSCVEKLGAKLDPENPKPWFHHPTTNEKVYVILDICHMFKLMRNLWKFYRNLKHHNKILSWNYIEALVRLQESEGLRAANKLTTRHTCFDFQKMKVKLATQLFSSSVSNSLRFCDEDLGIKNFKGCSPTSDFLSIMDRLFDALNSMHPLAKGYKAPLSVHNQHYWKSLFRQAETLLLKLRVYDGETEIPLHKSKRRTAVVGLICSMHSVSSLMSEMVLSDKPTLKYLLTYKLSQDHIETFFSSIRSVLGNNTNPNVSQFKSALKKILTAKILPNKNGNCTPQDETEVSLLRPNSRDPEIHDTVSQGTEDYVGVDFSMLSQFNASVVTYISGWVVRKLRKKVKCETCLAALEGSSEGRTHFGLILRKQNGGLVIPSEDVVKICKTAETSFRTEDTRPNFQRIRVVIHALKYVQENNVFENLHGHLFDTEPESNHIILLSKLIINEFLNLRMHHAGKAKTLQNKPTTIRNRNTTLTHFSGV